MIVIIILGVLLAASILLNLLLAARYSKAMYYNRGLFNSAVTAIEERDNLKKKQ